MDREQIAFAAMKPFDMALGAFVAGVKATGQFELASDWVYERTSALLATMYRRTNDLTVDGLDHVPMDGGVLFASNHQSWGDVQVITATAPRRVRFLAKSEFGTWPVLRHLIALSDSPFIRRGGDADGMSSAVERLKAGKALGIFPEGTIPGEEDKGRHEVEPDTGLLRGHTGAVRMAIAAGVPIVPVGVSGTGASFPPEVYPRLELLEPPGRQPITVRYGKPLRFDEYAGRELTRDDLRAATKKLMLAISALVDHGRGYVPVSVPVEPLPRYGKVGVLLLHGFTSSVKTVSGLVPALEAAGLPYRMPVLRGHGTVYTDLAGITAREWYEDAEKALLDLAREVDRVVVVGLSMGGLVALELGTKHPEVVAAVVTWGAAMRFKDPLAPLTPLLARVVRSWPAPEAFHDKSLKATSENYPKFATDAFGSLLGYARETEARLGEMKVPLCVLQSKRDQIIDPLAANLIYRKVGSAHREIHWFSRSGHEMGQDMEREQVFARTMEFIRKFVK